MRPTTSRHERARRQVGAAGRLAVGQAGSACVSAVVRAAWCDNRGAWLFQKMSAGSSTATMYVAVTADIGEGAARYQ
jgi:hypothetical protein